MPSRGACSSPRGRAVVSDGLEAIGAAPEIGAIALQGNPDSEVTFVPALTGLGPHTGSPRRGTLFGLTRATTLADIARATLEGVAFQIADLIEAIQDDLGSALTELRVDGGMARSDAFLQFQADVLGQPIRRSPQTESTALGRASWPPGCGTLEQLRRSRETARVGLPHLHSRPRLRLAVQGHGAMRRAVETVIGHYHKEHPAR